MPKKIRRPTRDLKPVLRIYCEGEKTEPNYLKGYIGDKFSGVRIIDVIQIVHTKKNTPVQLVDEAINKKNDRSTPDGDEFWVVYDRESPAKYSDKLHAKAYDKATRNGVGVALSNVCFEVWIALHFKDTVAPSVSYDQLRKKENLSALFQSVGINNYDKGNVGIYDAISDRVNLARVRAVRLKHEAMKVAKAGDCRPYECNPYTDVHELLDAIDTFGEEHAK
jgi:hypothetical protein